MTNHISLRRDSLSLDAELDDYLIPRSTLRSKNSEYVEAQEPHEISVSKTRKLTFLLLYFLLNLGLTLSNKQVLGTARYPWLLTALHAATTSIGCLLLKRMGYFKCTNLSSRDNRVLIGFSCLFTANIATSNVSLYVSIVHSGASHSLTRSSGLVSVPFHQVLRSTVPIVTIMIYRWVYGRVYSCQIYLTMLPLIGGVGLATFGDYYFTVYGFLLTFLGVVLAATKSVAMNRLITGTLKLSPLELLYRMSPLAAVQSLLVAFANGELQMAQNARESDSGLTSSFFAIIGVNAIMAFSLNWVSFETNKVAGALTISVCANLKQILTILLGMVMFRVRVVPLQGIGMCIAVLGAAWYSKAEVDAKRNHSVKASMRAGTV